MIRLMWSMASESKPVHSRYSWLSQAWKMADLIRIRSAVRNWFRRRTSHELNSLDSIRLMWSTASEPGLRNAPWPCCFAHHYEYLYMFLIQKYSLISCTVPCDYRQNVLRVKTVVKVNSAANSPTSVNSVLKTLDASVMISVVETRFASLASA